MTVSNDADSGYDLLHLIRTRIDGKTDLNSIVSIIGLVNGLNEVCKAVDRKEALICVLAEDCSDPKYAKLVTVSNFVCSCLSASIGSCQGQQRPPHPS